MRKLYNEYFYIPKHEKIREKVMLTRVVMTVAIVILCLAATSLTAYAYFSCNITSSVHTLKSANFGANITITDENDTEITVANSEINDCTYQASLEPGIKYYVTLTCTENTISTGYATIAADGYDEIYHTQQIGKTVSGMIDSVTFEIKSDTATTITIITQWGTSSYYADFQENGDINELYVTEGEAIELQTDSTVTEGTTKPENKEETNTQSQSDNEETADDENSSTNETEEESNSEETVETDNSADEEVTDGESESESEETAETEQTDNGADEEVDNSESESESEETEQTDNVGDEEVTEAEDQT